MGSLLTLGAACLSCSPWPGFPQRFGEALALPPKLVISQIATSHVFASKSAFTLRVMPPAAILRDKGKT